MTTIAVISTLFALVLSLFPFIRSRRRKAQRLASMRARELSALRRGVA